MCVWQKNGSFYASQFCLPEYKNTHGGTRACIVVITETKIRRRRLSGRTRRWKTGGRFPFLLRVNSQIKRSLKLNKCVKLQPDVAFFMVCWFFICVWEDCDHSKGYMHILLGLRSHQAIWIVCSHVQRAPFPFFFFLGTQQVCNQPLVPICELSLKVYF